MQIEKYKIEEHNQSLLKSHQRRFEFITSEIINAEEVIKKLMDFQIAIPSWALGTGGTRFGRFPGDGEPRSLEEKISDVGILHALNQSSGAISLHIPWDIPKNVLQIKSLAAQHGIKFEAMNSNTFQDQPNQKLSYKFGSMQHVNPAVRKQAVEHNIEVINYGFELGSKSITVWLADGSSFPGQLNFRRAFENTLDSLQQVYATLPADWKMYSSNTRPTNRTSTQQQWAIGASHYYMQTNWEPKPWHWSTSATTFPTQTSNRSSRCCSWSAGKLGGFHFNDSKYSDDDLTVGSIKPYQLFLIFNELVQGMDANDMNHVSALSWMIDASHNLKDPLEDLLQSVEAIMIAYAQALTVDRQKLLDAQNNNDAVAAQEILQRAFRTDTRPLVAEARVRTGAALEPLQLFRDLNIRKGLIKERD